MSSFFIFQSITSEPEPLNPLWPVANKSFSTSKSHVVAKFVPTFTSCWGLKGFTLMSKIRMWRSSLVCIKVLLHSHRFYVHILRSIFLLQIVCWVSKSQTLVVQSRPPLTIILFLWLIELIGISWPFSSRSGFESFFVMSNILIMGSLEHVAILFESI